MITLLVAVLVVIELAQLGVSIRAHRQRSTNHGPHGPIR